MEDILFEIIQGKRRNSKLLYTKMDKQLYIKKTKSKKKIYYVCYKKNCKARVTLEGNKCVKISAFTEHYHGDEQSLYEELKVLNNIKSECMSPDNVLGKVNALSSIRQTFQNACQRNQESTRNIDFSKIKRSLQYLSQNIFATSPKTPAEVEEAFQKVAVYNNFGISHHGIEEKLPFFKKVHIEKDFSYCVFASEKIVTLIKDNIPEQKNRKILIDGTFAVVPIGCFKQLKVVHVEYYNKVFPFLFILMNRKLKRSYAHLFSYINENIINLDGAVFITDYEIGLRKAIQKEFPNSKLFGCWFHFCQAVRRKITTKYKNLATYVRQNKKASLEYHKLLSIPLLPANHIHGSFEAIKNDIEMFDHHFKFNSFLNYYKLQWLEKIGPNGVSVFGTVTRTTSAVEAYNGVLGRIIPKHGNFFKFVKVLQAEEFNKGREMELLVNSGGTCGRTKRSKLSIVKSEKIEKASHELSSGQITASAFLNRMVYPKNQTCTEMEPEDDMFEDIEYMEEEEDEEDDLSDSDTVPNTQSASNLLCVVCLERKPNILLFPCKHLKICSECVLKLQAESLANGLDKYNCPICRQDVDDHMQVFL